MVPLLTSRSNFKEISAFKIVKRFLKRESRIHVKILLDIQEYMILMETRVSGTIRTLVAVVNMKTKMRSIMSV